MTEEATEIKANDAVAGRLNLPCYASLTTQILDLVSFRDKLTDGTDYRAGHDTLMYGIDDEAEEIAKKWVAENIGDILIDAIASERFAEKFADVALNTPMNVPAQVHAIDFSSSIAVQIEAGGHGLKD